MLKYIVCKFEQADLYVSMWVELVQLASDLYQAHPIKASPQETLFLSKEGLKVDRKGKKVSTTEEQPYFFDKKVDYQNGVSSFRLVLRKPKACLLYTSPSPRD